MTKDECELGITAIAEDWRVVKLLVAGDDFKKGDGLVFDSHYTAHRTTQAPYFVVAHEPARKGERFWAWIPENVIWPEGSIRGVVTTGS